MGKLDQYCFDGTNALSLKNCRQTAKKIKLTRKQFLQKQKKNQEKILHFRISFTQMQKKD